MSLLFFFPFYKIHPEKKKRVTNKRKRVKKKKETNKNKKPHLKGEEDDVPYDITKCHMTLHNVTHKIDKYRYPHQT